MQKTQHRDKSHKDKKYKNNNNHDDQSTRYHSPEEERKKDLNKENKTKYLFFKYEGNEFKKKYYGILLGGCKIIGINKIKNKTTKKNVYTMVTINKKHLLKVDLKKIEHPVKEWIDLKKYYIVIKYKQISGLSFNVSSSPLPQSISIETDRPIKSLNIECSPPKNNQSLNAVDGSPVQAKKPSNAVDSPLHQLISIETDQPIKSSDLVCPSPKNNQSLNAVDGSPVQTKNPSNAVDDSLFLPINLSSLFETEKRDRILNIFGSPLKTIEVDFSTLPQIKTQQPFEIFDETSQPSKSIETNPIQNGQICKKDQKSKNNRNWYKRAENPNIPLTGDHWGGRNIKFSCIGKIPTYSELKNKNILDKIIPTTFFPVSEQPKKINIENIVYKPIKNWVYKQSDNGLKPTKKIPEKTNIAIILINPVGPDDIEHKVNNKVCKTFQNLKKELVDIQTRMFISDYHPYFIDPKKIPDFKKHYDEITDQVVRILNSCPKILILSSQETKFTFYKVMKEKKIEFQDLSNFFGVPSCLIKKSNTIIFVVHHPSFWSKEICLRTARFIFKISEIIIVNEKSSTNEELFKVFNEHTEFQMFYNQNSNKNNNNNNNNQNYNRNNTNNNNLIPTVSNPIDHKMVVHPKYKNSFNGKKIEMNFLSIVKISKKGCGIKLHFSTCKGDCGDLKEMYYGELEQKERFYPFCKRSII